MKTQQKRHIIRLTVATVFALIWLPIVVTAEVSAPPVIGQLYWVGGNQLSRSNPDGSEREVLVKDLEMPDGLIVDLFEETVYWTNMGRGPTGSLQRSRLDGAAIKGDGKYLVAPGLFETGKEIEMDRSTRQLFWADRDGMSVMVSNLDGSNARPFIRKFKNKAGQWQPLENPVGIALDEESQHIYFTDRFMGKIMRASTVMPSGETAETRTDVEILFDGVAKEDRLIDIDLDLKNRKMYWTDRGRHHVARADLNGSNVEILISKNNMTIEDPIGITLDLPTQSFVWSDMTTNGIYRANLDGSSPRTLLQGEELLNGVPYGPLGIVQLRLQPMQGKTNGNESIRLIGKHFVKGETQVWLGDRPAVAVNVLSENLLEFISPAQNKGLKSISVETRFGKTTVENAFEYLSQ